MTKKLYAAVTAALLGLAMSCGEAGEDIAGLIQGINNGETQATSVFVQFNGGAGKPAAQKFDFFRTAGEPVITFTNPEISSKEDWLALKEKTGYDFVNDPEGLGPNWGGGGDETQLNPAENTLFENNFLPPLKDEEAIPAADAKEKEYDITGFSVKYSLSISQIERIEIPEKLGSEFINWKITAINSALSAAEGPALNTEINPSDISYTLTYTLKDGDALEFPASALLKPLSAAYVTVSAVFKVDEHTAAAINDVEALINDIQNQLNSGSSGEKLYDTDDPLVGKPPADSETAAKALDDKVKAAQDAVAGDSVGIEVTLDDFVWDDESGDYKKDEVTGELIPLTTTVTYIVYDTKKIKDAETELKKAIEAAKEAQVGAYVSSVITLSSRNTDDSDKDWKSVTIVNDGVYKITISGANGGHAWSQTNTLKFGGKGGYVVAQKDFKKGDVLKIRIGTEGKGLAIFDGQDLVKSSEITTAGQPGGWPNGGSGGKPVGTSSSDISTPGSGGGGATDVYYVGSRETGASATLKTPGEKGQLGNLTRNNDCLLLVAGGGGGAGSAKRVSTALGRSAMAGGDAGSGDSNRNAGTGAIPATWTGNYTNSTVKTYTLAAALSEPYTNIKTSVAYDKLNITSDNKYYGEYAKNDIVTYDTGASGQGVNGANGDTGKERAWEACGGGGGGYYGGNAIKTNYTGGGGGGGSNYIGSGFSNTTNDTSGVYGNGAFKIEYVSAN